MQETLRYPPALRGLAVLVVDDNETHRDILEELLRHWQMRPAVVAGARPALERLERSRAAGDPFRIVLADACMPDIDGFALAGADSRSSGLTASTILMLTSDRPEDRARCSASGSRRI
jgi:CheY-like chemotaxis protein